MLKNRSVAFTFLVAAPWAFVLGCGGSTAPTNSAGPSPEGAAYILASEPTAAQSVKEVRADAQDAQEVTLVGRIGGDENPWVEGQAAFLIVDKSLKPCNEQHDDACATPWDYCCDTDALPANKVLVKVVDASGKPIATDARKLLGLKELQTVVVHGKAQRDEAGNLSVMADGIFVSK